MGLLAATNLLFSETRANTRKQLIHRTNIRIHFAFLHPGSLIMTAAFACAMLIPRGCNMRTRQKIYRKIKRQLTEEIIVLEDWFIS